MKKVFVVWIAAILLCTAGCLRSGTLARFTVLTEEETTRADGVATYRNGKSRPFRANERLETNGLTKLEIFVRLPIEEEIAATLFVDDGREKKETPFRFVTGEETYAYVCLTDFPKTNFTLSYELSY